MPTPHLEITRSRDGTGDHALGELVVAGDDALVPIDDVQQLILPEMLDDRRNIGLEFQRASNCSDILVCVALHLGARDQDATSHDRPDRCWWRNSVTRKSISSSMSNASSGGIGNSSGRSPMRLPCRSSPSRGEQVHARILLEHRRQVLRAKEHGGIVVQRPSVLVPEALVQRRDREEGVVAGDAPSGRHRSRTRWFPSGAADLCCASGDSSHRLTWLTSLSRTSFIGTRPSVRWPGRSRIRTSGNVRAASAAMSSLSVSIDNRRRSTGTPADSRRCGERGVGRRRDDSSCPGTRSLSWRIGTRATIPVVTGSPRGPPGSDEAAEAAISIVEPHAGVNQLRGRHSRSVVRLDSWWAAEGGGCRGDSRSVRAAPRAPRRCA